MTLSSTWTVALAALLCAGCARGGFGLRRADADGAGTDGAAADGPATADLIADVMGLLDVGLGERQAVDESDAFLWRFRP